MFCCLGLRDTSAGSARDVQSAHMVGHHADLCFFWVLNGCTVIERGESVPATVSEKQATLKTRWIQGKRLGKDDKSADSLVHVDKSCSYVSQCQEVASNSALGSSSCFCILEVVRWHHGTFTQNEVVTVQHRSQEAHANVI